MRKKTKNKIKNNNNNNDKNYYRFVNKNIYFADPKQLSCVYT